MTNGDRPFAVFDIDGTLIRWQLYHALADQLVRSGHLDTEQYQHVKVARMDWKKRAHESSFRQYEETLVRLIDAAISQVKVSDLEAASLAVIDEYKDQVYTYTRELIKSLRAKDYYLFAISASPSTLVAKIAEHYGLDGFAGTDYEVRGGYFTGKKDLLLRARKPEVLKQLVAKHHASWQGSIAVGDSESDIPMLAAVEQPVAFNPTRELFDQAKQAGWKVVVERKNVTYELERRDGSYRLKT